MRRESSSRWDTHVAPLVKPLPDAGSTPAASTTSSHRAPAPRAPEPLPSPGLDSSPAHALIILWPARRAGGRSVMEAVDRPRVLAATTLIGDIVRNPAGENLGKVEDLMIDVDTGQVAYAVLSFGGFLGMGNKLFAVPWEALEVDFVEKNFLLDVEPETLKN